MPTLFSETPKRFNLKRTLYSHGWYDLLPFELDETNLRLTYVFSGGGLEKSVSASICEEAGKLKIEIDDENISATAQEQILRGVRHILRLDDDLSEFYKIASLEKEFAWIAKTGAGRLLRSPTVFEDLVKTLCTTNCSWAMTKKMTTNLVEALGEPSPDGRRAFPTAAAMASESVEFYKNEIRAGYRAPYFVELAEKVASGELNPEAWLTSDLPTPELKKEMKRVKGIGDYAAENLLKLIGRYDGLALDSWLRAQYYRKHNSEKPCEDARIKAHYDRYGSWRGLFIWCEMTEKWI